MNCNVQGVYKNLRFRILTIDGHFYILDLGSSVCKIIFPFLFWVFPNPIFKVEDRVLIEKLKTPEAGKIDTNGKGLIGGGIAVILANLIKPITEYFNIQSTPIVNILIVIFSIIILVLFRCYINYINKKKIYKLINLENLEMDHIWIKPTPKKHFWFISGMYLFFLIFVALGFGVFIEFPNVMMFFITVLLSLIVLFISFIAINVGPTTIKFKKD